MLWPTASIGAFLVLAAGCATSSAGDAAALAPDASPAAVVAPVERPPDPPPEAATSITAPTGEAEQIQSRGGPVSSGALGSGRVPDHLPFIVDPEEVHAAAKQTAGTIAQTLTTYDPDTTAADIAARIVDGEQAERLAGEIAPLVHAAVWSRGRVVYPQLGGMRSDRCSVMVVVAQEVGVGDHTEFVETRTLDIRLRMEDGAWVFDELASAGGVRLERPVDLPEAAAAVLDNPRIELPDSARWDIYRGHTSLRLLELMDELAEKTPYGVVVLASGHPHNVFATDRTSNHTVGKAVDVYRLGDTRVIDDRGEGSSTYDTVAWLYDHSLLRMVGSPWALDGVGGRSFTDVVHQDHLHISVRG